MDLYQEEILEHYKHPHHHGKLPKADVVQREHNPLCGDQLTFYVTFADDKVTDIAFEGEGCAISQASASMLSDEVIGMSIEELKQLQKEDIIDLLGIELGPTRLKCALLSIQGLTRAGYAYKKTNVS